MAEDNPPNATLYVRNLDERAKIPAVVDALKETFGEFGNIVEVVAKKSVKRKGQAFIVFESAEEASDALDALQGFDILDRPVQIAFAKTRSDATVKREEGEEGLEKHKKHRLAEKERKQALEAAAAAAKPTKRAAGDNLAERPAKTSKAAAAVADEYLPPNKILVLRDLPKGYTKEQIQAAFARFPGFKEIRTVPGRHEIAFAEYEDENGAITAKEAMNGVTLGANAIKVTYQKQSLPT